MTKQQAASTVSKGETLRRLERDMPTLGQRREAVKQSIMAQRKRARWQDVTLADVRATGSHFIAAQGPYQKLLRELEEDDLSRQRVAKVDQWYARWSAAGRPSEWVVDADGQMLLLEPEDIAT